VKKWNKEVALGWNVSMSGRPKKYTGSENIHSTKRMGRRSHPRNGISIALTRDLLLPHSNGELLLIGLALEEEKGFFDLVPTYPLLLYSPCPPAVNFGNATSSFIRLNLNNM
jgi:hypothetical protein